MFVSRLIFGFARAQVASNLSGLLRLAIPRASEFTEQGVADIVFSQAPATARKINDGTKARNMISPGFAMGALAPIHARQIHTSIDHSI